MSDDHPYDDATDLPDIDEPVEDAGSALDMISDHYSCYHEGVPPGCSGARIYRNYQRAERTIEAAFEALKEKREREEEEKEDTPE